MNQWAGLDLPERGTAPKETGIRGGGRRSAAAAIATATVSEAWHSSMSTCCCSGSDPLAVMVTFVGAGMIPAGVHEVAEASAGTSGAAAAAITAAARWTMMPLC